MIWVVMLLFLVAQYPFFSDVIVKVSSPISFSSFSDADSVGP
jgi:hypothetical protein